MADPTPPEAQPIAAPDELLTLDQWIAEGRVHVAHARLMMQHHELAGAAKKTRAEFAALYGATLSARI